MIEIDNNLESTNGASVNATNAVSDQPANVINQVPSNQPPSPQSPKKPTWLVLIVIVALVVIGGSGLAYRLYSNYDQTQQVANESFGSLEESLQVANQRFDQELAAKRQAGELVENPELWTYLSEEAGYSASTYFIEKKNYFKQYGYMVFELSYNKGTGGDRPILLVHQTDIGFETILDNQRDSFAQINCESLFAAEVTQKMYDTYIKLNYDVYNEAASHPFCSLDLAEVQAYGEANSKCEYTEEVYGEQGEFLYVQTDCNDCREAISPFLENEQLSVADRDALWEGCGRDNLYLVLKKPPTGTGYTTVSRWSSQEAPSCTGFYQAGVSDELFGEISWGVCFDAFFRNESNDNYGPNYTCSSGAMRLNTCAREYSLTAYQQFMDANPDYKPTY